MNEEFIEQVHNDTLDHWLWGKFDMLSGDDKSTWFWLAKNGSRMLYVPDALVTTIEVVEKQAFQRAFANLKRWSGNTIRNSSRVISLGPRKLGFFLWWSVVDQRVSMFTVLFGPVMALMAVLVGDFDLALAFMVWVIYSRFLHASISWYHGRRFSIVYVPVQVISEWVMAVIKIWTLFHPASQRWFNRGNRTMDTTQGSSFFKLRKYYANYLVVFSFAALIWTVSHVTGLVNIHRETILPRISRSHSDAESTQALVAAPPASNYFGYRQNLVRSDSEETELERPAPILRATARKASAPNQFFGYSKHDSPIP